MIHPHFTAYIETEILPQRQAHPAHLRLDGKTTGGNRQIAGLFYHQDRLCKVHADSHYEPLLLAYDAILRHGAAYDPFRIEDTNTRAGTCLVLIDEVQHMKTKPKFKHLYIYAM
jgi:hypothetical protein